jgi:CubicO group peptidase (beta-lactamase class C family)
MLRDGVANHAFPGAAVAITHNTRLVALQGIGRFTYEPESPEVTAETIYDLASVSKVVGTTAMAMLLWERGLLDLEVRVADVIPKFAGSDARRGRVTVRMLLAHSSGLPAYERLYERTRTRDELLAAAFSITLEAEPGMRTAYSDIGFIILGELLERVAGESLDTFCSREIFQPLGMSHTRFNPLPEWKLRIPSTVDDREFRHRMIQGEVHDENASVMGGIAGHAGIFSTAADVARFAHCMLQGGQPILRRETVELFATRQAEPLGSSRALGWDTPSQPSQSGRYFSPRSFGHLGYTGTSLWIDPERQLSVTLLTNRTWPDCSSQEIKEFRPRFHDAVVESLDKLK